MVKGEMANRMFPRQAGIGEMVREALATEQGRGGRAAAPPPPPPPPEADLFVADNVK